jgi:histidyl-tRNA synthetase
MSKRPDKLSTEPYKGVRDFYPEEQFIQRYIFEHMERVCELYGYEEYNASIFEPSELYRSKTSDEIVNDQTYSFTDRGEREVTLRPEMTPTFARMIAGKFREIPMPARWYSIANFFRYERQQRGRFREFWQLNADIVGSDSIESDAEIITIAYATLRGLGAEDNDFEIRVSDRRILEAIFDEDALGGKGKEWDLQIFNIVKFFELCRENNPNMIDSLFTPENCVIHCTQIGRMVRDNRRLFLSKEAWKKFRGYAHSQLKKMNDKEPVGKRKEIIEKHGFDIKFAYHIIRLLDEAEQIILEGDLNLQRAREPMKAIRRGEWTAEEVREWAMEKEKALEAAYPSCTLPDHAPVEPIRQLLINCLEEHYGSLSNCIAQIGWAEQTLKGIDSLIDSVRKQLYSA